jgi:succinoglycan biosynthesis protein ExoW
LGFDATSHPAVPELAGARAFAGDMFEQILKMNVIETSTVVYRFAPLSRLRFRPDFRFAFEDYLFWIELARSTSGFVFSTQVGAIYGRGINIYKSAGYGTEGAARRTAETMRFFRHLRGNFTLTRPQKKRVRQVLAQLRRDFAADLLHRVRHRKSIAWHWLGRQLRADPLSALMLPVNCAAIALGPRRYDPAQSS